jgi:epoxyqueuosine reductase
MNKQESLYFQKLFDSAIQEVKDTMQLHKPRLLLHACCAPCSSYVIEYLSDIFDTSIFFYNPNIHPFSEYKRRLDELSSFLNKFPQSVKNNVKLIVTPYQPEEYFRATRTTEETNLQTEPEKGERCRRCYELRMIKTFNYAVQNQFEWFTTTLSISPYKDAEKINIIGQNLEKEQRNKSSIFPRFLSANFKKNNGYLRSLQISKEYTLYRQEYCGCIYSFKNLKHT